MVDTAQPASADAGTPAVAPPPEQETQNASPPTQDDLVSQLNAIEAESEQAADKPDQAPSRKAEASPDDAAPETEPKEPDEDATEADASAEESEGDEDHAEAGDDDGQEDGDAFVHGNAKTRLRDGTVVTLGELKKSFEKAQQFDALTPQIERAANALREKEQTLAQREQQVEYILWEAQQNLPQPPSFDLLNKQSEKYNPIEYTEQKALYDAQMAFLQQRQMQYQQLQQQSQAEQRAKYQEDIKANRDKLLEWKPELKDRAKAEAFVKSFEDAVTSYGFSREEAAQVTDYRIMQVMDDAMKWRSFEATKKETLARSEVVAKPKPAAAGKPTPRVSPVERDAQKLNAMLKNITTKDDLVAFLNQADQG